MEISNSLFQSLLRQQNISEFRHFRIEPRSIGNSKLGGDQIKIDYRYINLNNIYAYIKDDVFHICNEKFEDFKLSDIYFQEKGIHHIGYNDESYFYPFTDNENSLVIDNNGRIVFKNPKEFFYVGTNEFLQDKPIFLNDYEDGILYNLLTNTFVTPMKYNYWEGYEQNYNAILPKIGYLKPIVNGSYEENLNYLFSVKKNYINPPHITSFFTHTADKSVVYFESSKYGSDRTTINPVCIWYTNSRVFAVSIRLLNDFDEKGHIIRSNDLYSHSISFEVKVNSGLTFDCASSAILEFHGRLENKYDLEYIFNNLEFVPTKNSLLILYSDGYRYSHHAIIVNDIGIITLCKHIECSRIALTENNILHIVNPESNTADYCDIFGHLLCTADKHSPNCQVFTRNLREPNVFNSVEISAQKLDNRRRFYDDGVYSQFEGVIDLQSGNIIVPPCFSKIQLRELTRGYDESLETPMYVSIVQVDNYFNGIMNSYFGIYQNETITTPLAYSNIQFLKYKSPKEEVYDIRYFDEENCFKEYESIFILLEKDGLCGVASKFGVPIIEPCANSYKILSETKRIPISNEENKIFLHQIPNYNPEYIALRKDGSYNLIYRDKIISDFLIDDFELISLGNELFFIKALCNHNEALVFNGKFITKYFREVRVLLSKFGNSNDREDSDFVIVLIDEDGKSSLLNSKSETVIQFGHHKITPYYNFVICDSRILDVYNNLIFGTENYTLIDEKKGCHNEHILCFHCASSPSEYVVINTDGEVITINTEDDSTEREFYVGYKTYYFDTDLLHFEEVPEDEEDEKDNYRYDDYPDDTDYERDTFYALGGDDYDEWKNNGGNLDDMMDGMGY